MSFSSICFQKLARRRARSVGFVERVVVTPLAWHTPEKTDRRVELGRFSRFSKLIPRRRIGLCRFPRFVQLSVEKNVMDPVKVAKLARRRARSVGFVERVVVTLRAPHLVSGSLLLPPFTQRSARNSVEKNVNRLPQLIPRRRIGLCRFPRFVSKSWQDDAHGELVLSRES